MTKNEMDDDAEKAEKPGVNFRGWLYFPLSLFPLVALATYDWRSIGFLQTPPAPSTNWIGALGDMFAYFGYQTFGLAIWIAPAFFIAAGFRAGASGVRGLRPGMRTLWRLGFMASAACLLQAMQGKAPGIDAVAAHNNLMSAGGAVGYMIMGRWLSPLLSGVGASVLALTAMAATAIGAAGADNLARFFTWLWRWTCGTGDDGDGDGEAERAAKAAAAEAVRAAKEEARRQREEEKRLMRERKLAEKQKREEAAKSDWSEKTEDPVATEPARPGPSPAAAPDRQRNPAQAAQIRKQPQQPSGQDGESGAAETGERGEKTPYVLPPVDLLDPPTNSAADHGDTAKTGETLVETLKLFGVDATIKYIVEGPVVTKYAVFPAPGTRYSAITSITDNLKGALRAKTIRIETPIPGEDCIGIEVPNVKPAGISFREVFESDAWKNSKAEIPLLFGKDAAGKELIADLAAMPHMLVAGATGQGKSVCLNSIINGLLMTRTPEQLKMIMVDPKSVEFTPYASIPHLLVPVITDNKKVIYSLNWAVVEMEKRLKMFSRAGVRNIYSFNHRKRETQAELFGGEAQDGDPKTVPYIVIIIDEVADLMQTSAKEVTPNISRIAAKARAAGIHLILATQRPDAKVITGTIKSNIPGRVAFKTAQAIDSRTILDEAGAESLIGRGDMLFKGKDSNLVRAQGAWISDGEIERITDFISQHSETQFDEYFAKKLGRVKEATIEDPFAANEDDEDNRPSGPETREAEKISVKAAADADDFKKAVECIINTNRASTSHFQRQLGWGYNHSAKILDRLAEQGIVSQPQGMGPRQILMSQEQLVAVLNGNDAASAADAIAGGAEESGGLQYAQDEGGGDDFEATDGDGGPDDGDDNDVAEIPPGQ